MTGDYRVIHDARDNYGHYFEEFSPGDVYKHWPGKTITEADNHIFTLLTMNTNPLHIDEEYMSRHQHGKILVVGPLVLSLALNFNTSIHHIGTNTGPARRSPRPTITSSRC